MVGFKKFLLTASLLLGGIAAAPTSDATGFNVFDKRALTRGTDASRVCENEFVQMSTITSNGGSATVADLTGCTAVFFFTDNTLNSVYHISCVNDGNEMTDGETAGEVNSSSNYAVIVAANSANYDAVKQGIMNGNSEIQFAGLSSYDANNIPSGKGIFVTATTGSRDTTQDTRAKVCVEP